MEREILDAIREQTEAIKRIKEQLEKLNTNLERLVAKELALPLGPEALDPERVRYEDTQLLEARRTMSEPDYVVFHADIMAGRAITLGQHTSAARIRNIARTKAAKLRRQSEG